MNPARAAEDFFLKRLRIALASRGTSPANWKEDVRRSWRSNFDALVAGPRTRLRAVLRAWHADRGRLHLADPWRGDPPLPPGPAAPPLAPPEQR